MIIKEILKVILKVILKGILKRIVRGLKEDEGLKEDLEGVLKRTSLGPQGGSLLVF